MHILSLASGRWGRRQAPVLPEVPWEGPLGQAVQGLPRLERQVFIRRYWYLDTTGQIAQDLGLSHRKTEAILRRLRQRLRQAA